MLKKRIIIIFLILIHLLTLGEIIYSGGKKEERDLIVVNPADITLTYIENEGEDRVYVEGLASLSGGEECDVLQFVSKEFELRKGVYNVTMNYMTSTNPGDQSFFIGSIVGNGSDNIVRSESIRLYNKLPNPYFKVYVKEDTTGEVLINRDADCRDAISMEEVRLQYSVKMSVLSRLVKAGFWLIILDLLFVIYLKKKTVKLWLFKEYNGVVLVGLLTLLFVSELPMTIGYLTTGYDLHYHLYRIQATASGLLSGMFPVRVQPEYMYGMGYADGTFYGSLFLMIPVILYAIGLPIITAYKVYVFVINFLSVGIAYYSYDKIVKNRFVALGATSISVLSMHRLVAMYNRGASGVVGAMAFVPLLAAAMYMIYAQSKEERGTKGWMCLALAMTGIIQFHTLTALLTTIVLAVFALMMYKWTFVKDVLIDIACAIGSFILLNLYYLVPFFDAYLSNNMNVQAESWKNSSWQFSRWGVYLAQMFSNKYSVADDILLDFDTMHLEMPLTLGIGALILLVLAFAYFILERKDTENELQQMERCFLKNAYILTLVFVFLASNLFPYSWLEKKVSFLYGFMQNFQYPWRFLAVCCCLIPVIFLFLYKEGVQVANKKLVVGLMLLIIGTFAWQGLEFMNEYDHEIPPFQYENGFRESPALAVSYGEYLPEKFDRGSVTDIIGRVRVIDSDVEAQMLSYDALKCTFYVKNDTADNVCVSCPMLYYKGYAAKAEQTGMKKMLVQEDEAGTVSVSVPAGYEGNVIVSYQEAWYWRVSECISLLFMIGLIIWYMRKNRMARERLV